MESSPDDDEKLSCVCDIGVPKSSGIGRRTCTLWWLLSRGWWERTLGGVLSRDGDGECGEGDGRFRLVGDLARPVRVCVYIYIYIYIWDGRDCL
jgi:hypothetical protein